MSNENASEWLRNKGWSIQDIDFVESVLTFTSTAKALFNWLFLIKKQRLAQI